MLGCWGLSGGFLIVVIRNMIKYPYSIFCECKLCEQREYYILHAHSRAFVAKELAINKIVKSC